MKHRLLLALLLLVLPIAAVDSAPQPEIRPFVRGSWHELRKAHEGQPIVVHFWGLTCGPCLAELPSWEAEAKRRPDLQLVLIDASPFGDDPKAAWAVLSQIGLSRKENWVFADRFEERLRFEIDPHWHGEMPYTLFIGRDGTVTATTGVTHFADLNAWLDRQAKTGS